MTEQGLSILIPQYNQEVTALLQRLEDYIPDHLTYEFVVANDNDQTSYPLTKEWLNTRGFRFIQNSKNIGRAKNRNQLADASQHALLLFMDEDMMPKSSDFIANYLEALRDNDVVVGGHIYAEGIPKRPYRLHWKYGRKIESKASLNEGYSSFSSAVFGIKKTCFNAIKFHASIEDYGHEDSLFGASLKQQNYRIQHINEPCYHLGLHPNRDFIERSFIAIKTLCQIERNIEHPASHTLTRLQTNYAMRKKQGFGRFQLRFIQFFRPLWKWTATQWSSVTALQLYKLSCYCYLKKEG